MLHVRLHLDSGDQILAAHAWANPVREQEADRFGMTPEDHHAAMAAVKPAWNSEASSSEDEEYLPPPRGPWPRPTWWGP